MSDHLDAPGLNSPNMDARVDITDIFAFQKPGRPNEVLPGDELIHRSAWNIDSRKLAWPRANIHGRT